MFMSESKLYLVLYIVMAKKCRVCGKAHLFAVLSG